MENIFANPESLRMTESEQRATRMFQFVPLGAGAGVLSAQKKLDAWLKKKEREERRGTK
jgi:hypothetical protein